MDFPRTLILTACRQDAAALRQMVLNLLEELDSKERRLTRPGNRAFH
jgi:hypothetical protein